MPILIPRKLAERKLRQGNANLRLEASSDPKMRDLVKVNIHINGQLVGQCMRGHREIWVKRQQKKGYFSQALSHLEEIERALFEQGHFEEYKGVLLKDIKATEGYLKSDVERETVAIKSQKEPVHFDYTTMPEVAATMMKRGYLAHEATVSRMRENGFDKAPTKENIVAFFEAKAPKSWNETLYLFVKPVKKP